MGTYYFNLKFEPIFNRERTRIDANPDQPPKLFYTKGAKNAETNHFNH
jgi:hypothetical protein